MAFFTSWQTWVKLTFVSAILCSAGTLLSFGESQVLACSIVSHPPAVNSAFADGYGQCVVLVYATGVRYSNKRKLKKHSDRIATEIEERGEMAEAVRNSEEVPFGIRAIERGCMVDGIWNSKATTPLHTPSSSKASSPVLKAKNTLKKHKRESSLSNVSQLDIPEPASVPSKSTGPGIGFLKIPSEEPGTTPRYQVAAGVQHLEHGAFTRDHLVDGPEPALYHDRTVTATQSILPLSKSGSQPEQSWSSNGTLVPSSWTSSLKAAISTCAAGLTGSAL
jgi:hypothetical protein